MNFFLLNPIFLISMVNGDKKSQFLLVSDLLQLVVSQPCSESICFYICLQTNHLSDYCMPSFCPFSIPVSPSGCYIYWYFCLSILHHIKTLIATWEGIKNIIATGTFNKLWTESSRNSLYRFRSVRIMEIWQQGIKNWLIFEEYCLSFLFV